MLPRAKKRFGQHFLTDRYCIDRIVGAIAPQADDVMIEIGPGPGAITAPLIAKLNHLHAVEIDRDLASALRTRFPPEKFTLHETNALDFYFEILDAPFRCVGNLPYNISTPFLFHLAGFAEQLIDGIFMLQKEVVDRMVAAPDTEAAARQLLPALPGAPEDQREGPGGSDPRGLDRRGLDPAGGRVSTAAEFSPEVANEISPLRCVLLLVKRLPLCLRLPSAVDPGVWAVRLGEG